MATPPQGQNPYPPGPNTYGQQPPPAQGGYGYPPQQGMPPQPGPYGQGAPVAMAPQRPRRGVKAYLRVAGAIVGVIIVAATWYASKDDADTASVGDCMHRGSTDDNHPDLEVVECSSSTAQYKVLAKIKGSFGNMTANSKCEAEASDFTDMYTETGSGDSFLLCLKEI